MIIAGNIDRVPLGHYTKSICIILYVLYNKPRGQVLILSGFRGLKRKKNEAQRVLKTCPSLQR